MICDVCGRINGHMYGCPEATSVKRNGTNYYCSICEDPILNGEEYIRSLDGDYIHMDCAGINRELIEFLGGEIREMEDEE